MNFFCELPRNSVYTVKDIFAFKVYRLRSAEAQSDTCRPWQRSYLVFERMERFAQMASSLTGGDELFWAFR